MAYWVPLSLSTMEEDEIDHQTADHLGVGVSGNRSAEILFTHNRSLNSKFYDWIYVDILGNLV
jgi:hypothetical protein